MPALIHTSRLLFILVVVAVFIGSSRHAQVKTTRTDDGVGFDSAAIFRGPRTDNPTLDAATEITQRTTAESARTQEAPSSGVEAITTTLRTFRRTVSTQRASTGTTPSQNVSTGTTPARNVSTGTTPARNVSTGTMPARNVSTGITLSQNVPTGTTPAQNVSTGTTPARNVSTGTTPARNVSTGTTPAQNVSTGTTPAQKASTGTTPSQNVSTGTTPARNVSTGTTPSQNVSTGTTAAQKASTGAIPIEKASPWTRTPPNTPNSEDGRPCHFSLAPKEDYDFKISPASQQDDVYHHAYTYNRGQNVTLTCEMKNATKAEELYAGTVDRPYLIIRSCTICDSVIASEAAYLKTELTLVGRSMPSKRCQFSCWLYYDTCSSSSSLLQEKANCLEGWETAEFRTIDFGDLPSTIGIQCVSTNWEDLVCTWTLREGSPLEKDTDCSVYYTYPCKSNRLLRCNATKSVPLVPGAGGTISAQLTVGAMAFEMNSDYRFSFSIRSKYGEVSATHSVRSGRQITKYDPVEKLQVTADVQNSSLLHVSWNFPRLVKYNRWCESQLRITAQGAEWMDYEKTLPVFYTNKCQQHQTTVTGLRAHVNYVVHVQFRLHGGTYWSNDATASGTTAEDVPSAAPEVTSGGYQLSTCSNNSHCLTVYWKELPPQYRNGLLTAYEAVLNKSGNPEPAETSTKYLSATFSDIGLSHGARACVSAATSAGISAASSCMAVLPPESNSSIPAAPREVTTERISKNGTYVVQWNTSDADGSSNSAIADYHTVFWCRGTFEMSTVTCESEMNWSHVGPGATSHTVHVESGGKPWCFGVASLQGNRSHGITWNKYTFSDDGVKMGPQLEAFGDGREITATVTLASNVLFSYVRPERYELYFNQIEAGPGASSSSGCFKGNKVADVHRPEISRRFLITAETDGNYSVCVRTFFGKKDIRGQPQLVKVKDPQRGTGSSSQTQYVVGSLGGVVAAIVIVGLICCLCKRKRRKEKLFSSDITVGIQPPPRHRRTGGAVNDAFGLGTVRPPPETTSPEVERPPAPIPGTRPASLAADSHADALPPRAAGTTSVDPPFVPAAALAYIFPDSQGPAAAAAAATTTTVSRLPAPPSLSIEPTERLPVPATAAAPDYVKLADDAGGLNHRVAQISRLDEISANSDGDILPFGESAASSLPAPSPLGVELLELPVPARAAAPDYVKLADDAQGLEHVVQIFELDNTDADANTDGAAFPFGESASSSLPAPPALGVELMELTVPATAVAALGYVKLTDDGLDRVSQSSRLDNIIDADSGGAIFPSNETAALSFLPAPPPLGVELMELPVPARAAAPDYVKVTGDLGGPTRAAQTSHPDDADADSGVDVLSFGETAASWPRAPPYEGVELTGLPVLATAVAALGYVKLTDDGLDRVSQSSRLNNNVDDDSGGAIFPSNETAASSSHPVPPPLGVELMGLRVPATAAAALGYVKLTDDGLDRVSQSSRLDNNTDADYVGAIFPSNETAASSSLPAPPPLGVELMGLRVPATAAAALGYVKLTDDGLDRVSQSSRLDDNIEADSGGAIFPSDETAVSLSLPAPPSITGDERTGLHPVPATAGYVRVTDDARGPGRDVSIFGLDDADADAGFNGVVLSFAENPGESEEDAGLVIAVQPQSCRGRMDYVHMSALNMPSSSPLHHSVC